MAALGEQNPLLLSGRAAQRLAAIYRQHKPERPGLAVPHQASTSFSRQAQPRALCTAILDVPCQTLPHTCTSSRHGSESQWHKTRDIHTEVWLTCATLCKLSMLHGSLAQVHHHLPQTRVLAQHAHHQNLSGHAAGCKRE